MSDHGGNIARVLGREILDSRGRPTVEAEVHLQDGSVGRASAPAGASRGRHEAWELRDADPSYYGGYGVQRAVSNVCHEIADSLIGHDGLDQQRCDERLISLDSTPQLSRLGSNAVLATSMALCRAAAAYYQRPLYTHIASLGAPDWRPSLPMPMTNILSGGAHASRGMDIQDFLIVPIGACSYPDALQMNARVRDAAAELMGARGLPTLLADEGGLSPGFGTSEEALDLMMEAFAAAGLTAGQDVAIALDVAASELYKDGMYDCVKLGQRFNGSEMAAWIGSLIDDYPIVSVEDPLDQDDWDHWKTFFSRQSAIQVIGDDLFATNIERINRGAAAKLANAVLIKLNQNGTVTGTIAAMAAARSAGLATIVSARSGETDDDFIADLAVGTGAGQIKIGSTRNAERLAKYNQLLRIGENDKLPFVGRRALAADVAGQADGIAAPQEAAS